MSILKRLSATMFSRVDQVVSEIENHDAVIESAIRDNRRALAKARVRFNRLEADGRRLAQRLEDLRTREAQWTHRAQNTADQHEQTALRCLQKRRECRRQITATEQALAEHRKAESRLAKELEIIEERVTQIGQQRNLMRSRQSTAEAMRTFKALEDSTYVDIDDTFERWEVKIAEAELASGERDDSDDLEQDFIEAEELANLREELKELAGRKER
ncbi:MAG TPA: PspA/IM30 family protein [Arenicellales bacterium]|nr:PspA/IM30 family protein [Arenicellales bacterium]